MKTPDKFLEHINAGYLSKGDSILLGSAILDGETIGEAKVAIPLKTMNRHGLIAGATGTGKPMTIQVLSDQLSAAGVPVLMMDIKGDFSGIAMAGEAKDFTLERTLKMGVDY